MELTRRGLNISTLSINLVQLLDVSKSEINVFSHDALDLIDLGVGLADGRGVVLGLNSLEASLHTRRKRALASTPLRLGDGAEELALPVFAERRDNVVNAELSISNGNEKDGITVIDFTLDVDFEVVIGSEADTLAIGKLVCLAKNLQGMVLILRSVGITLLCNERTENLMLGVVGFLIRTTNSEVSDKIRILALKK